MISTQLLRTETFARHWPLDPEISAAAAQLESHAFLRNPAGQYPYIYLTRFVKEMAEQAFDARFTDIDILDWGCGKGHVSKLLAGLGARRLASCDVACENPDSAFGQETPIIRRFGIPVKPLEHEYILPYDHSSFDIVLSVGVLEHVPDDRASLREIVRVLKPGGLFFCFFLPTKLSWTQKVARLRGNNYHERFYNETIVRDMLRSSGLELLDLWYRQLFPKNSVRYPSFRFFERIDQLATELTPLRYFATNLEFVGVKPK